MYHIDSITAHLLLLIGFNKSMFQFIFSKTAIVDYIFHIE